MIEFRRREALVGAIAVALLGPGCKGAGQTSLPQAELQVALRKFRKRVQRYVADQDRRYRALALLDEGAEIIGRLDLVLLEWREALVLAPEEQRRDRARALAVTETFNVAIADVLRDAARVGIAMREPIRADEWARVFPEPRTRRSAKEEAPC